VCSREGIVLRLVRLAHARAARRVHCARTARDRGGARLAARLQLAAVLERAEIGHGPAVPVPVERDRPTVEVAVEAVADPGVYGGARPAQVEVPSGLIDEARRRREAVRAERELRAPAVEEVVVLVRRPVRIPHLPEGLDDVVAQGGDVGSAARVADEALTVGAGEDD